MPVHTSVGSNAATLTTLISGVEASGEKIISVLAAGDSWVVVTAPPPTSAPSKPRKQTR